MRKITCTNEDNISVTFGDRFSPFLLQGCDGIYSFDVNINTADYAMADGAAYNGSNVRLRNIVLNIADRNDHAFNRDMIYTLFRPKSFGNFRYYENDNGHVIEREIGYYVESVDFDGEKRTRTAQISLVCPDPYFKDLYDTQVIMAGWQKKFIFPHAFLAEKEELGTLKTEKIKTIFNNSAENIGLTIKMQAIGNVKNPGMLRIEDNASIIVGIDIKPLNMVMDDVLTITTGENDKNIYFTHDGETVNINEYIDESSTFLQLKSGNNTFRYFAEEGEDYLLVSIFFRHRFLGV